MSSRGWLKFAMLLEIVSPIVGWMAALSSPLECGPVCSGDNVLVRSVAVRVSVVTVPVEFAVSVVPSCGASASATFVELAALGVMFGEIVTGPRRVTVSGILPAWKTSSFRFALGTLGVPYAPSVRNNPQRIMSILSQKFFRKV